MTLSSRPHKYSVQNVQSEIEIHCQFEARVAVVENDV